MLLQRRQVAVKWCHVMAMGGFAVRRCSSTATRSFDEIPGPASLPLVGTLYKYAPYFGEYTFDNLLENAKRRYKKYGHIVKETLLPGVNVLHIFHPDDIETVMRFSGKYPERRSHIVLAKYRHSKPDVYSNAGMLASNGSEWYETRSVFQKYISSPKSASKYVDITNVIVDESIARIQRKYANEPKSISDFTDDLARLNLQLLGLVIFDAKIDCFSEAEILPNSLTTKLIKDVNTANDLTFKLDTLPPFLHNEKYPLYRKVCEAFQFIEEIAVKLVTEKMNNLPKTDDAGELSLLENYLKSPDINLKDIIGASCDFLLAGFDTTTNTTSFALYHLAKNANVQQKLYEESLKLLPNPNDCMTSEIINKALYLKAFLKEVLRVNPISIGLGRTLTQDVVLSGYNIPAGTTVVTNNQVSCGSRDFFDNVDRFSPERWLKGSDDFKTYHPFLSIPFGHGSRMCVARRLAEQNMYITIFKLIRNFKLAWEGKDLQMISMTINKPHGPLKLIFERRHE